MTDYSLDEQQGFWDGWNLAYRGGEIDGFMSRQAQEARREAKRIVATGRRPQILEIGCGTGWLAGDLSAYGDVTATDLSEKAIELGRSRHPDVQFLVGDIAQIGLGGPYDLVVSADVISHVADQRRFVTRVSDLLAPGGTFLLMTQNPFVWNRSSMLAPQGSGQLRNWPSLEQLRSMLDPQFTVRRVTSIVPFGDRGILRFVNARVLRGAFRLLHLDGLWRNLLERARVGRELVVAASRN